MSVKDQVRKYVEEFVTYGDPVADDQSLINEGTIDSTGAMELVMFLEETFNIEIDDEEIDPENLDTLNQIESFIEGKTKEAA